MPLLGPQRALPPVLRHPWDRAAQSHCQAEGVHTCRRRQLLLSEGVGGSLVTRSTILIPYRLDSRNRRPRQPARVAEGGEPAPQCPWLAPSSRFPARNPTRPPRKQVAEVPLRGHFLVLEGARDRAEQRSRFHGWFVFVGFTPTVILKVPLLKAGHSVGQGTVS